MWSASDEASGLTPAMGSRAGWDESLTPAQYIYSSTRNNPPVKVKKINLASKRTLDGELTDKATRFILRWPGNVPAGKVSNEIVHITDLFTNLVHAAGAQVPNDRVTDLREEHNIAIENTWALPPMMALIGRFKASLQQHPPIASGTPDPYLPDRSANQ